VRWIAAHDRLGIAQQSCRAATALAARLIRAAAGLIVIAEGAAMRAVAFTATAVHITRSWAARVPGVGAIVHAILGRIDATVARRLGDKISDTRDTAGSGASAHDAGEAECVQASALPLTKIAVRHIRWWRVVRAVLCDGLRERQLHRLEICRGLRLELCEGTVDRGLRHRVDGAGRNGLPIAEKEPRVVLREGAQRAPVERTGTLTVVPHEHEVFAAGEPRTVLDVNL
jgi:hypothetical protein